MKRKPIAVKGQHVVTEEGDEVTVIETSIVTERVPHKYSYTGYKYHVKYKSRRLAWIDEDEIIGVVKYQPVVLESPAKHFELVQALYEYETLRDWLEEMKPRTKRDKVNVRLLKELLENAALLVEGSSNESDEAHGEIENILK